MNILKGISLAALAIISLSACTNDDNIDSKGKVDNRPKTVEKAIEEFNSIYSDIIIAEKPLTVESDYNIITSFGILKSIENRNFNIGVNGGIGYIENTETESGITEVDYMKVFNENENYYYKSTNNGSKNVDDQFMKEEFESQVNFLYDSFNPELGEDQFKNYLFGVSGLEEKASFTSKLELLEVDEYKIEFKLVDGDNYAKLEVVCGGENLLECYLDVCIIEITDTQTNKNELTLDIVYKSGFDMDKYNSIDMSDLPNPTE